MGKVTRKIKRLSEREVAFERGFSSRETWLIRNEHFPNALEDKKKFYRNPTAFEAGQNLALFRYKCDRSWFYRAVWCWIFPPVINLKDVKK